MHHTLKGKWGLAILRILEAGSKTLLIMAPLFVVIVMGMGELYPWAKPDVVKADQILSHKQWYLNSMGFIVRAVVAFALWGFWSFKLIGSTKRQEATGDLKEEQKRSNFAPPGIVIFVLTVTMIITDWVMSLDKHWFSTIFGVWFVVGQGLAVLSFSTIFLLTRKNQTPYKEIITPELTKDLGNLMLAFSMIWAYFTFSQFLIIWSGNLPEETEYFKHRLAGMWNGMGTIVVLCQFLAPFLLLLSGNTKRTPSILLKVAVLIFAARFLDLYWNIVPFFVKGTENANPINMAGPYVIAWVAMGAVWIGAFEFFRKQASPLPTYDPRLLAREAAHHA